MKILFSSIVFAIIAFAAIVLSADVKCPEGGSGPEQNVTLIPNPKNCSQYYMCDGTVPILKECPKGLHFNPKLEVCDFPAQAGCKK